MRIRAVLAAVALLGAAGYWLLPSAEDPGIDPLVLASVSPDDSRDFTISNIESRSACLLVRGRAKTGRSRSIDAGHDCDQVWPGLATAHNWTQNDDGTVVLTDDHGEAIVTFALGDGVDYEAIEPANAMLTVTAAN